MHALFAVSLIVQVLLATHAYRSGRTSPWVWIILFFPLVGSILYTVLFLVPKMRWTSSSPGLTDEERTLKRVPPGPFAARGDRPDNPRVVESTASIEPQARREDCPDCGDALHVGEQTAETIAGRKLRVVVLNCRHCGAMPVRYYTIRRAERMATR